MVVGINLSPATKHARHYKSDLTARHGRPHHSGGTDPRFLIVGHCDTPECVLHRLARVADRVEQITKGIEEADAGEVALLAAQLSHLRRRSLALDAAVLLAAFGGAATCASVLTLFVGALRDATVASVLFTTFGIAVMCTIGAIGAFTAEMLMAGSGVRAEVAAGRRSSEQE